MNTKEKDEAYISHTYKRFPVEIVRGSGSLVYDENGKEYVDMGTGIGVTAFGVSDPVWKAAVTAQLDKIQHMSNLYYTSPMADLAEILCVRTGFKKVFFGNSGAEANECAIKAARKYASEKKGSDHYTIITLTNSFHGRTLTTLAATGQDVFHKLYNPLTPGFEYAEAGNMEDLEKIAKKCSPAAIMIECIQGEGGVVPLDAGYIKAVADFAQKNDILLIIDEVQTGNGRTGKLYSYMHFGIMPDIITTAKGIGGGLPLGACLLGEKVKDIFGYGDHGSTFGGNPAACAGAISVLNRIDDKLLASVAEKGEFIKNSLEGEKGIESVTGLGLMLGVKTARPASEVVNDCMEKGVLALTAKDKVRLLPALNIPEELLSRAVEVIKEAAAL